MGTIQGKNFNVRLELVEGLVVCHSTCFNWSKSAYYEYLDCLADLLQKFEKIFCPVPDKDKKMQKFVNMLLFQPTEYALKYEDNVDRRLWVCHQ